MDFPHFLSYLHASPIEYISSRIPAYFKLNRFFFMIKNVLCFHGHIQNCLRPLFVQGTAGEFSLLLGTTGLFLAITKVDGRQIQALIVKKKLCSSWRTSIRRDLHLEDAGDAEVTLVNETQERQDEDLMFDTRVLDGDEMFVDAKTGEKDEQSTKINDSTAGEAVTTQKSSPPIVDQPSTSSPPKKKQKSKRKQRKEAEVAHDETEHEESVPTSSNDPLPSGEDTIEIAKLKKRVDKLEKRRKFRTTGLNRIKKVGAATRIESSNDKERSNEDLNVWILRVLDGDEILFVDATTCEKDGRVQRDEGVTSAKIETITSAMIEPEVPLKRKDQVALDEDLERNYFKLNVGCCNHRRKKG
ncbi:hypothetical protein Tco_1054614 [Tanacetum coccineum]|uniref:Uncharacterized protein n=1 Tax=Tanacetum coccineum TaxID=301880 RepID=A0ABQ5GZD5_9ASTR